MSGERMFSHGAHHCGDLSPTFSIEQLPQVDLWGRGARALTSFAAASLVR